MYSRLPSFLGYIATSLILFIASFSVGAEDIARAIRTNSQAPGMVENYIEFGRKYQTGVKASLGRIRDDYEFEDNFINGSLHWGDWFVERFGESNDPYLFGYAVHNDETWSIDLIFGVKYEDLIPRQGRLEGLGHRNSATLFGGRATGFFGDNIVQFSLRQDISEKWSGHEAFALVGRNWQVKNWNFHGMAGVKYFSSGIIEYYYGISEEESRRTGLDAYKPGSFFTYTVELGVTYPLSEHLVFRATAKGRTYADEATDSPIFVNKRSTGYSMSTSLSLVF